MSKALTESIVTEQNAFPEYRFIVLRFRVVVAPLQSGSIKMTIKDGKKLNIFTVFENHSLIVKFVLLFLFFKS